jgi:tetratricopeptide (TPR) repeat protein
MVASARLPHAIVGAVTGIVLVLCGTVQVASDALYAKAPFAPPSFGLAVYEVLDRVVPAAYVEDTLGHAALAGGDVALAQHYALRMPAGSRRDDLLGQIADARGQSVLGFEYAFAAADADALQRDIMALAKGDPRSALALELQVRKRLIDLGSHPDAVAEADFTAGSLASWSNHRRDAYAYFESALAIAPLNMKYELSAANQALALHDYGDAARFFSAGLNINPASGDALAGLGLVALDAGDRAGAKAYLARARAADPHAPMLAVLERALQ